MGFPRSKIVSKFEFTARKDFSFSFFFFYYYLIFYIEAEGRIESNGLNVFSVKIYITLR